MIYKKQSLSAKLSCGLKSLTCPTMIFNSKLLQLDRIVLSPLMYSFHRMFFALFFSSKFTYLFLVNTAENPMNGTFAAGFCENSCGVCFHITLPVK